MKKIAAILVFFIAITGAMAQSGTNSDRELTKDKVSVVYSSDDVSNMEVMETLEVTLKESLNMATKSKIEKLCLDALKEEAANKGYSLIMIDETASTKKKYNKRDYKVTLVAKAYKS